MRTLYMTLLEWSDARGQVFPAVFDSDAEARANIARAIRCVRVGVGHVIASASIVVVCDNRIVSTERIDIGPPDGERAPAPIRTLSELLTRFPTVNATYRRIPERTDRPARNSMSREWERTATHFEVRLATSKGSALVQVSVGAERGALPEVPEIVAKLIEDYGLARHFDNVDDFAEAYFITRPSTANALWTACHECGRALHTLYGTHVDFHALDMEGY